MNRCALPPCMCLTQVYEIDCDALICGPLLWPGQIGPAQMQFCRPARCSASSGATAGRLETGPGRRVRTALDIPAPRRNPWPSRPGSIVAHGRPHLSRYPATPGACPSFRSFCAGQRHCRRELAAGHVRAGPIARAGAARCRLVFWLAHGSDVAGSNAAAVPPAAG